MLTETETIYALDDVRPMLDWPVEALLGVEYDDDRVSGTWLETGAMDDPVAVPLASAALRRAIRSGPSDRRLRVRLRSVSRSVDGYVYV